MNEKELLDVAFPKLSDNKDRTVQPELQRFLAKRMGAKTFEVESSHVAMLSNPKLVTDVIRTAANAVQESAATK